MSSTLVKVSPPVRLRALMSRTAREVERSDMITKDNPPTLKLRRGSSSSFAAGEEEYALFYQVGVYPQRPIYTYFFTKEV